MVSQVSMLISIATGIIAGAIHVVGGVDHLVGMAPAGFRHPKAALRDGLAWGLGHSSGVLVLSMIAIFAKDLVHLERMSSVAEFSVGIVLLLVGGLAIKSSLGLRIHTHAHGHIDGHVHDHIHLHFRDKKVHSRHPHASTSLGLLHGLAGASHLLAVIPALALPPIGAFAYMAAYLVGSIVTMGLFLLAISLATIHAGQRAFPLIIGFAGGLSVVTGLFWIQKTSGQLI